MIKKHFVPILAVLLIIVGCSDDDSGTSVNNASYFDSSEGTSWDYDVQSDVNNMPVSSSETLSVATSNGNSFTMVSDPIVPAGLMSTFMTSGDLEDLPGTLLITGNIGYDVPNLANISLAVSDFPLYDASADDGETIVTSAEESFTETIENIPLTFTYFAEVTHVENLDSHNVGSTDYSNVTHSRLVVSLEVFADFGITQLPVLAEQDVVSLENYWAEGVGLIQSDGTISYEIESVPGVTLPFPNTETFVVDQQLTSYTSGSN